MYIANKVQAYPTKEQFVQMSKTVGCSRYVYNYFLDLCNKTYKNTGHGLSYKECCNRLTQLKKTISWLKEPDSTALQQAIRSLSDAFGSFFKGIADHPTFHKKGLKDSYTTVCNCDKNGNASIRVIDKHHIVLPKLGVIYVRGLRMFEGKILEATITLASTGKCFVSILYEVPDEQPLPSTGKSVGIDLGLHDFITLSDGTKVENPKHLKNLEEKLAREQRVLSRRREENVDHYITRDGKRYPVYKRPLSECRNYLKQKRKVARIQEKIRNQRIDFEQKHSTEIVKNHDVICIEDLDIKSMLEDSTLAKTISDASWSEFVSMLVYKAQRYGRTISFVDRYYPSSQTCSECGTLNPITKDLSVRSWVCPHCGAEHDRDTNAALNIKREGLRVLRSNGLTLTGRASQAISLSAA
ncbi:MAG: IS200/IS605 family element transposase accessory protein TnpB [Solobacterium sp.]|nr:IS200/IS605 family element transposase accessory protein TnpB [Solobacterium sp.]